MAYLNSSIPQWASRLLSVLRIIAAFLMMQHGAQKLFGLPAGPTPTPTPPLMSLMGFVGVLEFFGGLLLLVGLFTRPVAFIKTSLETLPFKAERKTQHRSPRFQAGVSSDASRNRQ
ncbi:MAG: DoxX family membrane protein [Acidobacteria bacterium]|nr:DoxX family membrane protein [Acidobacteriota bacterium]